jgi:hypothetical protein
MFTELTVDFRAMFDSQSSIVIFAARFGDAVATG